MAPVAAPRPPRPIGFVHWLGLATLLRRELGRYFSFWRVSIAGPAFAQLLYLLIFVLALGGARETADGAAVLPFIAPGLLVFAVMQRSAENCTFSLMFDKLEGMVSDILNPPLAPTELAVAYAVSGAMSGLITGLPIMAGILLFLDIPVGQPLLALLMAVLSALMMASFGTLAGLWAEKFDHVAAVFAFFIVPLGFLSGLFAPIDRLPGPLQTAVQFNPIFYAIDGFRGAVTGVHVAPISLSLAVVAGTTLLLWLAANRLIATGYKIKA